MGKDFNESVDVLFNKVEDLVSTKTVVGDTITLGEITIIPFIEVSVGAAAGAKENINAMGGVGARITPTAIMVIQNGTVQIMNVNNTDAISKLIDMAPSVTSKINFGNIFGSRGNENPNTNTQNKSEDLNTDEEIITEDFQK